MRPNRVEAFVLPGLFVVALVVATVEQIPVWLRIVLVAGMGITVIAIEWHRDNQHDRRRDRRTGRNGGPRGGRGGGGR